MSPGAALRRAAVLAAAGAGLSACQTVQEPRLVCPAGQEPRRTAELYFGRSVGDRPGIRDADFRAFADKELSPRFPDGLTVLDGGGKWRGEENKLIREASKVVLIVLPKRRDATAKIDAVRQAYRVRFHQDSVLVVTQATCVAL